MKLDENWYEILEIPYTASAEEIKQAYFEQARQYHPDTNPSELAKEFFLRVQKAFEILSDPAKRRVFDNAIQNNTAPDEQIGLKIQLSSDTLQMLDEPQLLYAWIEFISQAKPENIKKPLCHICLVIDKSTSMKGRRIKMIADNIKHLTSQLNGQDLLSIITFNDRAEVFLTPTPLEQVSQIPEKICNIQCNGGTEIFQGLKAGADILWGSQLQSGFGQIILFTDGQTYGDEALCIELAKKLHGKGIKINTVGIGHEWNDIFLDKLSTVTGGNATFVSSTEDMSNFIRDFSDTLSIKVAGNINLDFHLMHEVKLKYIFRLQPDVSDLLLEKPIALGDLYQGKNSYYLAAFLVPPLYETKSDLSIARGKIRFEVYDPEKRSRNQFFTLKLSVGNSPRVDNPPREIVEALSRISVFQMQEKANDDVKAGKIDRAVKRLGSISTQLFRLGAADVAHKVIEEAQSLRMSQQYSLEGDKQLKYGTRALLSPGFEKRVI